MRAFVTGSTGLLGNNLVRILLQAGHEVWALARSKEKSAAGTWRHCRSPSHRGRPQRSRFRLRS
jgi:uncharacterized protein YbjT (DUF2867 family)